MAIDSAKQITEYLKAAKLVADEKLILTYETVAAAGAVSVSTPVTLLATTGAIAITLADGVEGQVKIILMTTDGGTATLTPANFANNTTIAFADVYDVWVGIFVLGAWYTVNGTTTVAFA